MGAPSATARESKGFSGHGPEPWAETFLHGCFVLPILSLAHCRLHLCTFNAPLLYFILDDQPFLLSKLFFPPLQARIHHRHVGQQP